MTTHIYYWDSSAVLSLLVKDQNSTVATEIYNKNQVNLISSLVIAEVFAVLARIERDNTHLRILLDASREAFRTGGWRVIQINPDFETLKSISKQSPLRGADLWHLSLVFAIKKELPDIEVVTFDKRLQRAAVGLSVSADGIR